MMTLAKISVAIVLSSLFFVSTAQEIQLSDETIKVGQYPLIKDNKLGVPTARIGEGSLHQVNVTIYEIPPGGMLPPQRHLAEEVIYIISGEGYTAMWTRQGEKQQIYNWSTGDMLSPTLNAWHQHINRSADEPARYLVLSSAPLVNNLFHNADLASSSDYVFEERWKKNINQEPEYTPEGTVGASIVRMKIGHQIKDLPGRDMRERRENVLGITVRPEGDMADNHIMEWEVREYQDETSVSPQHRHPWETVYFIMDGVGSAVLQREGEEKRRINWEKGDLLIVEANEFHELRPRDGSKPRFWQVKASGYFHNIGNLMIEEAFSGLRPEP